MNVAQKQLSPIVSLEKILLFLLLISLNFQLLSIKGWDVHDHSLLSHVKIYHVITLLFVFLLFIENRVRYKIHYLPFLFLAYTILISPILYSFYAWNLLLLNYIFALLIFFIFYNYSILNFAALENLIQYSFVVIYVVILVKLVIYYDKLIEFFASPWGHPAVPAIYGGDVNLEATWVALSTAFYMRNRKRTFYFAILFSLMLSVLYSSRVGFILAVCSYLIYFLSSNISRREKTFVFIVSILGFVFLLTFLMSKLDDVYVIERFTQIGSSEDGGSVGRLMLWRNIDTALLNNFFLGYGAGNSLYAIKLVDDFSFIEDNVHNYYLQILLDFGLIGFIIYSIFCVYVVLGQVQNRFTNPYGNFILLYFVGSMIQFRGAEPIFWLAVGVYFAQKKLNNGEGIRYES